MTISKRRAYAAVVALWAMTVMSVSQAQPAPAAASSLYYGVHVPGWLSDMNAVTVFETDAGKKASHLEEPP